MAKKGRKRKVYQAIGGPACGSRIPEDEAPIIGLWNEESGEEHWYWLIQVHNSHGKVARYWHYVGDDPTALNVTEGPRLFPANRFFR